MTGAETWSMIASGLALIGIELARSIPAWRRVRNTRRSDGISAVSVGILAGTGLGWVAVAVLADSWAAAVATVVWLVFHLLLVREVLRVTPTLRNSIVISTGVSFIGMAVVAVIGLLFNEVVLLLGIAIGVTSAAYSIPALITGMTSKTTRGLSLLSLTTNSIEGAIYFIAGLGLGGIAPQGSVIAAYLFFGGLALASNVPRLFRTGFRRIAGKDQSDATRGNGQLDAPSF